MKIYLKNIFSINSININRYLISLLFMSIFYIVKSQNQFNVGVYLTNNNRILKSNSDSMKNFVKNADSIEINGIGNCIFLKLIFKLKNNTCLGFQMSFNNVNYKRSKYVSEMYDQNGKSLLVENWRKYIYKFASFGVNYGKFTKNKIGYFSLGLNYHYLINYRETVSFYIKDWNTISSSSVTYRKDKTKKTNNYSISIIGNYGLKDFKLPNLSIALKGEYFLNSIYSNKLISNHLWNIGIGVNYTIYRFK